MRGVQVGDGHALRFTPRIPAHLQAAAAFRGDEDRNAPLRRVAEPRTARANAEAPIEGDETLAAGGWAVQDGEAAVREDPVQGPHGVAQLVELGRRVEREARVAGRGSGRTRGGCRAGVPVPAEAVHREDVLTLDGRMKLVILTVAANGVRQVHQVRRTAAADDIALAVDVFHGEPRRAVGAIAHAAPGPWAAIDARTRASAGSSVNGTRSRRTDARAPSPDAPRRSPAGRADSRATPRAGGWQCAAARQCLAAFPRIALS